MASRFPSIEGFDEDSTPTSAGIHDPQDLFSLEKAALGTDADQFANSFPALEDEPDLLGSGNDRTAFETSFPDLDSSNSAVGPGGTITGSTQPYIPGVPSTNFPSVTEEEEPEVIKQWRQRQQLEIQRRDELSEQRKQETIQKAQSAIDDFYDNYNTKKDKTIEQTRREAEEFLANRENTSAGGTSWERIAKLVDLSEKGFKSGKTDKTRFREILISLRKDEKAPGASGL